jgi:hypothetical protein
MLQVVVVASGATSSTRVAQLNVGSIPALAASKPEDWVTLRSSADVQVGLSKSVTSVLLPTQLVPGASVATGLHNAPVQTAPWTVCWPHKHRTACIMVVNMTQVHAEL